VLLIFELLGKTERKQNI